jgi:hypothetical protein
MTTIDVDGHRSTQQVYFGTSCALWIVEFVISSFAGSRFFAAIAFDFVGPRQVMDRSFIKPPVDCISNMIWGWHCCFRYLSLFIDDTHGVVAIFS